MHQKYRFLCTIGNDFATRMAAFCLRFTTKAAENPKNAVLKNRGSGVPVTSRVVNDHTRVISHIFDEKSGPISGNFIPGAARFHFKTCRS